MYQKWGRKCIGMGVESVSEVGVESVLEMGVESVPEMGVESAFETGKIEWNFFGG